MAYQTQGSLSQVTQGGIGDIVQALQQLLPSIGMGSINDYYTVGGGNAEMGNQTEGSISPELMAKLDEAGYTFGRTGGINQDNYWDVMKDGNVVDRYQTGAASGFDGFMQNGGALLAPLAGIAMGGLPGLGAGGVGGATGGGMVDGAFLGATGDLAGSGGLSGLLGGGGSGVGLWDKAAGMGGSLLGGGGGGGGLGGLLGNMSGGKMLAGGLGALAGMSGAGDQKQTSTNKLDPRMDAMLYGQGGFLPQMQQWFQQNQQPNQWMQQGAQQQHDFYNSPQYQQGFGQLRDTGMGLLGKGVAKNPFMEG